MTDRVNGAWVAFNREIREDDAESLVNALRMIRGVAGVELQVADFNDWAIREQIRGDVAWTLRTVVHGLLSPTVYVPDSERDRVIGSLECLIQRIKDQNK